MIALLPSNVAQQSPPPLVDDSADTDAVNETPPIKLLEGHEYRFEFTLPGNEHVVIKTDRPEVFQADSISGCTGRVRPSLYTGTLPVTVFGSEKELGTFGLEVRSKKLNYRSEYQWMLRDLAEYMTEVVMDRFGVAEHLFAVDDTRDAVTLYERFAFLRSLISGVEFQGAISRILANPHVTWVETSESWPPGRGLKASSNVVRQITRAGRRVEWVNGPLKSLPSVLERRRTDACIDNAPNRFVKFALTRWREVVAYIGGILREADPTPAITRGIVEVDYVLDQLDVLLAADLFREVSELSNFPSDDQVLQKKPAYRDVYRAYIQFEVASKLAWPGGEDVYGAGQRDVASLYEYWAFVTLAEQLSELLTSPFDFGRLIELRQRGLNVALRTGTERVLHGVAARRGRQLAVDLWFNRTFTASSGGEGAWSRNMRPDYSIYIRPGPDEVAMFEPIVLHFDAKYRVSFLSELFGAADESGSQKLSGKPSPAREAVRDDLLKMHAYRDAIRRSVGAYVIYPGTEHELIREYHELLPGLGAFALRPTESGMAEGVQRLKQFLEDVLNHVGSQLSQDERGRYWMREAFSGRSYSEIAVPPARFLTTPPADTLVLLGYVRDLEHWHWIERTGLYNVRAYGSRGTVELGSKHLASEIVVLSCPALTRVALYRVTKEPVVRSIEQMHELEYPNPRGTYFCFSIEEIEDPYWPSFLSTEWVEQLRAERTIVRGAPIAVTWLELVRRIS